MKKTIKFILSAILFATMIGCSTSSKEKSANPKKELGLTPVTLSDKELFYLNSFASDSLHVYDASWDDNSIQSLTFTIYKLEDGKWNSFYMSSIELEKNNATLILSENLAAPQFAIQCAGHSKAITEPSAAWKEGVLTSSDKLESFQTIKKDEEFPIMTYQRSRLTNEGENLIDLKISDWNTPENIENSENQESYIATLMFTGKIEQKTTKSN